MDATKPESQAVPPYTVCNLPERLSTPSHDSADRRERPSGVESVTAYEVATVYRLQFAQCVATGWVLACEPAPHGPTLLP